MNVGRRAFIKRGALALVSVGSVPLWGPSFLQKLVFAAEPVRAAGGKKTLVCVFQRGAVDGLSMVAPFGDKHYRIGRPSVALNPPSRKAGPEAALLDLNGFFGLHPSMSALLPIYKDGHLGIIPACGSPSTTRSHFDAQDFMECGVVDDKVTNTGWMNRALLACPEDRAKRSPFSAVSMTPTLARSLQGEIEALTIPDLKTFGVRKVFGKAGASPQVSSGFEGMYDGAVDEMLTVPMREAVDAIAMFKAADPAKSAPQNGARYPTGEFGQSMLQVAQLIKADVGVEVAFVEIGGWDTHVKQGAESGQLANKLREFSDGLAALYVDLGNRMADVVILTMSEFGRTVHENGSQGTDHGHATCFLTLGGPVRGRIYGKWPGLDRDQLFERRDLALTTDYRDVFAEIAYRHLGATGLDRLFPQFKVDPARFHGLIRA